MIQHPKSFSQPSPIFNLDNMFAFPQSSATNYTLSNLALWFCNTIPRRPHPHTSPLTAPSKPTAFFHLFASMRSNKPHPDRNIVRSPLRQTTSTLTPLYKQTFMPSSATLHLPCQNHHNPLHPLTLLPHQHHQQPTLPLRQTSSPIRTRSSPTWTRGSPQTRIHADLIPTPVVENPPAPAHPSDFTSPIGGTPPRTRSKTPPRSTTAYHSTEPPSFPLKACRTSLA